ncbi:unnamed protein product [Lactuca virosa]|uniref:Uncharacterized protein n=1 Tax=Lactuca virosa TaxID=75947 RepID=A0AAU9NTR9_9ASTR|nr:unnamed protein product [Lactuca virosa]
MNLIFQEIVRIMFEFRDQCILELVNADHCQFQRGMSVPKAGVFPYISLIRCGHHRRMKSTRQPDSGMINNRGKNKGSTKPNTTAAMLLSPVSLRRLKIVAGRKARLNELI